MKALYWEESEVTLVVTHGYHSEVFWATTSGCLICSLFNCLSGEQDKKIIKNIIGKYFINIYICEVDSFYSIVTIGVRFYGLFFFWAYLPSGLRNLSSEFVSKFFMIYPNAVVKAVVAIVFVSKTKLPLCTDVYTIDITDVKTDNNKPLIKSFVSKLKNPDFILLIF